MNISLNRQSPLNVDQPAPQTDTAALHTTSNSQVSVDTADTASISSLTSQISGEDSIREDRVSALKLQVESGTYQVNPHAVATAMFQNLFRS